MSDDLPKKLPKPPAELTDIQRTVLMLREEYQLPFKEIARRLGKADANIRRHYERARKKVKPPPPKVTEAEVLLRRWHNERRGEAVTDKTLLGDIDVTLAKALYFLRHNEMAMAEAKVSDLVRTVNTLIEKRQLLKGEPTQITKLQDVRKLDEIAKALHAEMERRGLLSEPVIDVTAEEVNDGN